MLSPGSASPPPFSSRPLVNPPTPSSPSPAAHVQAWVPSKTPSRGPKLRPDPCGGEESRGPATTPEAASLRGRCRRPPASASAPSPGAARRRLVGGGGEGVDASERLAGLAVGAPSAPDPSRGSRCRRSSLPAPVEGRGVGSSSSAGRRRRPGSPLLTPRRGRVGGPAASTPATRAAAGRLYTGHRILIHNQRPCSPRAGPSAPTTPPSPQEDSWASLSTSKDLRRPRSTNKTCTFYGLFNKEMTLLDDNKIP